MSLNPNQNYSPPPPPPQSHPSQTPQNFSYSQQGYPAQYSYPSHPPPPPTIIVEQKETRYSSRGEVDLVLSIVILLVGLFVFFPLLFLNVMFIKSRNVVARCIAFFSLCIILFYSIVFCTVLLIVVITTIVRSYTY